MKWKQKKDSNDMVLFSRVPTKAVNMMDCMDSLKIFLNSVTGDGGVSHSSHPVNVE